MLIKENTKRIFFQIISCFFFALLGLQIKLISKDINVESIVFYRSALGSLIILIIFFFSKQKFSALVKFKNFKVMFLRSIFGTTAMYCGYKALTYITLSQATTISFTKVFFTILLSYIFFNEKNLKKTFIPVIIGFFGVYLIADPKNLENNLGIYLNLLSALAVSCGILSLVYLSRRESTLGILFYNSFISSIIYTGIFYQNIDYELAKVLWPCLLLTFTAILGQYFNTESYKYHETSKIVLISYSRILFAVIFGFLFLDELLTIKDIVGFFIIVTTSILVSKIKNKRD